MGPSDRKRGLEFLLVSMEGGLLLPSEPVHECDGGVSGGQCPRRPPPHAMCRPRCTCSHPGPSVHMSGRPWGGARARVTWLSRGLGASQPRECGYTVCVWVRNRSPHPGASAAHSGALLPGPWGSLGEVSVLWGGVGGGAGWGGWGGLWEGSLLPFTPSLGQQGAGWTD